MIAHRIKPLLDAIRRKRVQRQAARVARERAELARIVARASELIGERLDRYFDAHATLQGLPCGDWTPVTAFLTPAQAVRLELIVASWCNRFPGRDTNDYVDVLIRIGLDAAEADIVANEVF